MVLLDAQSEYHFQNSWTGGKIAVKFEIYIFQHTIQQSWNLFRYLSSNWTIIEKKICVDFIKGDTKRWSRIIREKYNLEKKIL